MEFGSLRVPGLRRIDLGEGASLVYRALSVDDKEALGCLGDELKELAAKAAADPEKVADLAAHATAARASALRSCLTGLEGVTFGGEVLPLDEAIGHLVGDQDLCDWILGEVVRRAGVTEAEGNC
jgi:hypothetical protein